MTERSLRDDHAERGEEPAGSPAGFRVVGPTARGAARVLALEGDFDLAAVPLFERAAEGLPAGLVVVDLRRLDFIDSSGIAALLRTGSSLSSGGGALECVVPPAGPIRRTVELVDLGELLRVREEPL